MHRYLCDKTLLLILASAVAAAEARACSVCGCSLSSDWDSQAYGVSAGADGDLNFQYYDQDNLRSGTGSANRSAYALPNAQELQKDTLTRSTTLGVDYVLNPSWGLGLTVPYYDRYHSTLAPGDTEVSESRASGLGDFRLMARYQRYRASRSLGFQFGLKLPTGGDSQGFATGPQAGTPLDRGLQLGTGTTDVVLGVSYYGRPSTYVGYFLQATVERALAYSDGFLPSSTVSVNSGVRFLNTSAVTPMVQLNARWDGRERGANADFGNSGDAVFFVSPGAMVQAGPARSLFAFLQLPVFQRVNGLQLEPRWLLSVGFRLRL
jgi:hypothetical protein